MKLVLRSKIIKKIIISQKLQVLCLSSMDFTNASKFEGGARSPIHYLYLFNIFKKFHCIQVQGVLSCVPRSDSESLG